MDHGIGRAEDPLVGIAAFDPCPGLVASHNFGAAQNSKAVGALGSEDRRGALEHVHQRALAEMKTEQIAECALQPFVREELMRLEIERQGMNAPAKRRAPCRRWRGRAGRLAAPRASAGQPAVPPDNRLDHGQVNLVIFPDHRAGRFSGKRQAAMTAMCRAIIFVSIGRLGQNTGVPLMAGLGTPGREPSRLAFLSVDGGFDDVRDVLSGRCSPSSRSINSGFVSRSRSSRFMDRMNHSQPALARGWVVTVTGPAGRDQ